MNLSTEQLNMLASAVLALLTEESSTNNSCSYFNQNEKEEGGTSNADEHLGFHEDRD